MRWTDSRGFNDEGVLDDFSILLVDDDRDYIDLMRLMLKREGYVVSSASSADEALELLKLNRFTLMLTDYEMPEKDGLMLSEEAREAAPELTIIMATGNSSEHLKKRAATAGIMTVLAKPINFKELFSMIRNEIERQITLAPQSDCGPAQTVRCYSCELL